MAFNTDVVSHGIAALMKAHDHIEEVADPTHKEYTHQNVNINDQVVHVGALGTSDVFGHVGRVDAVDDVPSGGDEQEK